MARKHKSNDRARRPVSGSDRNGDGDTRPGRDLRLTLVISALLTLQGGALFLKAWDEKQTSDRAALEALEREAQALAAHLDGQVQTTTSTVELGLGVSVSRRRVAESLPGIDGLQPLTRSSLESSDSRIRAGATVAEALVASGDRLGMTSNGDLITLVSPPGKTPVFALAPASAWLPKPAGVRRFTLVGDTRSGVGDPRLFEAAGIATTDVPHIRSGDVRGATACIPLRQSALSVCSTVQVPLFGRDDYLRLIIYALLLAAPTLAILSLARRVSPSSRTPAGTTPRRRRDDQEPSLQPVLREAQAGAWRWDTATDVLELDAIASEMLGFGRSALSIKRAELYARISRQYHNSVGSAFEGAIQSSRLQTIFAIEGSVKGRFAEIRGGQITSDHAAGTAVFGGLVFDVSKAKQSDMRLRRAEERLRNAIDGFSGPFALWDSKHRLVFWNRSFELDFNLTGHVRAGVAQETAWLARAPSVRRERIVNDDNSTMLIELHDRRWLKIVEREIPDQGYITLGLDVTENVRNEDLLKQQKAALRKVVTELEQSEGKNAELARKYQEEKLRAEHAANTKSAFLANMSHELRTPLNAINGFSEMLVNELFGPLGDQRYQTYAVDILTAGRHLLDLINDILDMSKIEAGKMTVDLKSIDPVDPVDAAVRMVRSKADEKNVVLSLDADETIPLIDADHRAMRQMVLNLVSNAIKFTPEQGRVHVSVRQRESEICIAVTDTGVGIAKDDLERLGQPFEQVKQGADNPQKGTGLGLALTKSFAELHGGRLTMASEPGKGTRVSIYLPVPENDHTAVA